MWSIIYKYFEYSQTVPVSNPKMPKDLQKKKHNAEKTVDLNAVRVSFVSNKKDDIACITLNLNKQNLSCEFQTTRAQKRKISEVSGANPTQNLDQVCFTF